MIASPCWVILFLRNHYILKLILDLKFGRVDLGLGQVKFNRLDNYSTKFDLNFDWVEKYICIIKTWVWVITRPLGVGSAWGQPYESKILQKQKQF